MDYPHDFPDELRAKVEAAKIRAGRRFDSGCAKAGLNSEIGGLFWTYVLAPFLVFAEESARLALWPADEMDQHCREFLRRLTIDAYYSKGKAAGLSTMISNWNGSILWDAQQEIEKTSQWRKYENIRLKYSVAQYSLAKNKTARNLESRCAEGPTEAITPRRLIDAFIAEVLAKTGTKISRKDIWLVAGYNSATEFQRFQRNDQRTTQSAATNVHRVLEMNPEDFIRSLEKRKVTKSAKAKTA